MAGKKDELEPQSKVTVTDFNGPANHLRKSNDLIYDSIMRGGGEPFMEPYEVSAQSLTEKIVRYFKQKGFFGFEFFERRRRVKRRNKFTKYGAAPFRGEYK